MGRSRRSEPNDGTSSERDYGCGIGDYRPRWLQYFATPRIFFLVYNVMGVLQGAYRPYYFGIMSTIERRFGMSSKTTGMVIIGDNIGSIIVNLVAGYYANRMSRPKILSLGALTMVCSCLLSVVPFLVYGPGLHISSSSSVGFGQKVSDDALLCSSERPQEECSTGSAASSYLPFALFFLANFLNGAGGCTFFTVGLSYMDDNIRKKNSPLYLGTGLSVRLLGPVAGFLTAALCLRFYEDPFQDPGLSPRDPRWIGAWWLGYILFAVGLAVITLPLMLFPRILPSGKHYEVNKLQRAPKSKRVADVSAEQATPPNRDRSFLGGMATTLRRLAQNRMFMLQTVAHVFVLNAMFGYGSAFSKYLEYQFRVPASSASVYTGATKILTLAVGMLLSGVVVHLLKPRPTVLAGYSTIAEAFHIVAYIFILFIGCENPVITGVTPAVGSTTSLTNACNMDCNCTTQTFEPVCSSDGVTSFFSPCYAGCTSVGFSENNSMVYRGCNCIVTGSQLNQTVTSSATKGLCGQVCDNLSLFLGVLIAGQFLAATSRLGAALIQIRSVDPIDKSMAVGTSSTVTTLFAFMPYPLVYGAILDSTCLVWEENCGTRGNCWVYDVEQLRLRLHLATIGFLTLAIVCYIVTIHLGKQMTNFYEDDVADNGNDRANTALLTPDGPRPKERDSGGGSSSKPEARRTEACTQEDIAEIAV